MATVRDIVTRAYRKIGTVGINETTPAAEMAQGVTALNSMIHAWKLIGVDLEWADQAEADTFDLADEYHEGVVYLLASRLAPDMSLVGTFDADAWFRGIQAANAEVPEVTVPTALLRPPSREDRDGNLPVYSA